LKSTHLQFSRSYIFASFRNKVDINVPYDNTPFWMSADSNIMTLNDLECPIQLKVRFADGTLGVYTHVTLLRELAMR